MIYGSILARYEKPSLILFSFSYASETDLSNDSIGSDYEVFRHSFTILLIVAVP